MNEMQSSPPSTRLSRWLRPNRMVAVFLGVMLSVSLAHSAEQLALGSSDFKPSRQQPYGWRGDGSGCFPGATNPPMAWDIPAGKNVRWKVENPVSLPYLRAGTLHWAPATPEGLAALKPNQKPDLLEGAYASPVVLKDRVITVSEPNWVVCVDKDTGKELWKQELSFDLKGEKIAANLREAIALYCIWRNGFATPTPVSDGEKVWAVFGFGVVGCFNVADGKVLWTGTFNAHPMDRAGTEAVFGIERVQGSMQSPVLCGSLDGKSPSVLVTGGTEVDAFVGWNADTGERLWSVPLRGYGHHGPPVSMATPVRVRAGDKWLIVSGEGWVIDVTTGQLLHKVLSAGFWPSPVIAGDSVVLFDEENLAYAALVPRPEGEATHVWTHATNGEKRTIGRNVSSPLAWRDRVYVFGSTESGTGFVGLDAATGKQAVGLPSGIPRINSNPTLAGGYLYFFGRGDVAICQLKPDGAVKLVTTFKHGFTGKPNHHSLGLFNSPVFEGNRMYFRDQKALYCIEETATNNRRK